MNDLPSSRRGAGEDVLVAVALLIPDVLLGAGVVLFGLSRSGLNPYEPDPHISTYPIYGYLAVFAVIVLLSAVGLYRLRFRFSVAAQVLASAGLLLFCAAEVYG
ncbi:DUF6234 family protein [Streptomyces sp. NPDC001828]|uniref:DUF6234 family protein n=1 Tax=Streptomyces sp. NPDC001828 TaxID=3364615 RepID=UPI00367972EB